MKQRNLKKSNAGFTLVELIVVIAIMAILAGVGTVGYSGYIKNANKGADKTLVGNIMRAIETGTNSTMFVNDESFTKGATTYPVGVIVLSNENECKIKCTTSTYENVETACEMCTESFNIVSKGGYTTQTFKNTVGSIEVYTINSSETKQITYCKTHTTLPEQRTVFTGHGTIPIIGTHYGTDEKTFYFEEDFTGIFALATEDTGHVDGKIMTQEELVASGSSSRITDAAEGNALYDSLYAAYGDLSNLKLKYDGWGDAKDDGHTYATLLAYSDSLMGNIKNTINSLMDVKTLANVAGLLSEDYENGAAMMDAIADAVVSIPDKGNATGNMDEWLAIWQKAENAGIDYDFSFTSNKDFWYGCTKAYNSGFASYCKTNGIDQVYTNAIENFTTRTSNAAGQVVGNIIPRTVNKKALSSDDALNGMNTYETNLFTQFETAYEKSNQKPTMNAATAFEKCSKLYTTYISSGVCQKNGEMFMNTMNTVNQTGSTAYKQANGNSDKYFEYYENYLQEMAAFYQTIDAQDGKGIIIIVTVENGVVKCEVSPSSANPRND